MCFIRMLALGRHPQTHATQPQWKFWLCSSCRWSGSECPLASPRDRPEQHRQPTPLLRCAAGPSTPTQRRLWQHQRPTKNRNDASYPAGAGGSAGRAPRPLGATQRPCVAALPTNPPASARRRSLRIQEGPCLSLIKHTQQQCCRVPRWCSGRRWFGLPGPDSRL